MNDNRQRLEFVEQEWVELSARANLMTALWTDSVTTRQRLHENAERLQGEVSSRDSEINWLRGQVESRGIEIGRPNEELRSRDAEINWLRGQVESRDIEIGRLSEELRRRDAEAERVRSETARLDGEVRRLDMQIEQLRRDHNEALASLSWRLTAPVRALAAWIDNATRMGK